LFEFLRHAPELQQSILLYTAENLMRTNQTLRAAMADESGGVELVTARLSSSNKETRTDAALCLATLIDQNETLRHRAAAAGAVAALLSMSAAGEECFLALSAVLSSEAIAAKVSLEAESAGGLAACIATFGPKRPLPVATMALAAVPVGRRSLLERHALPSVARQVSALLEADPGSLEDQESRREGLMALVTAVGRVATDAPIHVTDAIKEAGGLAAWLGWLPDPGLRVALLSIMEAWLETEHGDQAILGLGPCTVSQLVGGIAGAGGERAGVEATVSVLLRLMECPGGSDAVPFTSPHRTVAHCNPRPNHRC